MSYLGLTEAALEQFAALHTAREICQQPQAWQDTQAIASQVSPVQLKQIREFLALPSARILLVGAGTSAFIGGCLAPQLAKSLSVPVLAVATTDIVSNPDQFLAPDVPTMIVSFGRSGNSPESIAAVQLADQCLTRCLQLIVTCNDEGKLFDYCNGKEHAIAVLTPPQTNDNSFAMTSSFSSMMLLTGLLLSPADYPASAMSLVQSVTKNVISDQNSALQALAQKPFDRVVYLGSGGMASLAQESALKLLELTDGETVAMFDSPLGFRHGPKTIVNDRTLIIVMLSNDPYTRKYDLDLLEELRSDNEAGFILALSAGNLAAVSTDIVLDKLEGVPDHLLYFPYIACAQIFAFHRALALGNNPDSPSASGTVNRVVQGVNLYPFENTPHTYTEAQPCS